MQLLGGLPSTDPLLILSLLTSTRLMLNRCVVSGWTALLPDRVEDCSQKADRWSFLIRRSWVQMADVLLV
jgi:hypothetical protein